MIKNGKYKPCVVCGKDFYIIPAQEKRGRGEACSIKCAAKLRSGRISKKKGLVYPHLQRSETRKCKTCGVKFRAINDHTGRFGGQKNRTQVYCSHSCYVKGNRISQFENMVFDYLSKFNDKIKRQIRIGRWTFDMKIDNTNILIEADGSYWHSFEKQRARDMTKNIWCNMNGFVLYRINELQFYKNPKLACQVIINRMKKLDPEIEIKKNGEVML